MQGRQHPFILVQQYRRIKRIMVTAIGRPYLWVASARMFGVFTICTGMCLSGWRTAIMTAMWAHLLTGLHGSLGIAIDACCVVARGSAVRGASAPRLADTSRSATSSVFELPGDFNSCLLTSLPPLWRQVDVAFFSQHLKIYAGDCV